MSINFYGRVIDENDRPIPAANVEFSWTDLSPGGNSTGATTSGLDGTFSLQGKSGRVLQVDVSKDGYYKVRSERLKSFDYAGFWAANYYEADPVKPILFHLRKKGEGERLSTGELHPPIPPGGTPVRFDLLNGGRISGEGQLEIAAVTNTEQYPPRTFDWRATISVPSGGLIEHNSEFPFEAPEQGYLASVAVNMPANAPNWQRVFAKTYFIKFGEPPKYGHIQVRLNGASQKATIVYSINPNGSRNLEPALTPETSSR